MTERRRRVAVAERAARAGGAVARTQFRGELSVETKSNKNDVITQVDRDTQTQVVSTIHAEFPPDPFLCEEKLDMPGKQDPPESIEEVPDDGPAWVIDPIDGTANFVRGMEPWTTSVAAVENGETVGSATYLPITGDCYTAGPDNGTRDGTVLSVSERTDPETFAVVPAGWWEMDERDAFGRLCTAIGERFGDLRRIGSFQATLAYIADGALDGAVCTTPTYPWDTVAGVHMIRQAGGTVTDIHDDRWTPDSTGLVASNGECHDVLLEAAEAVE
jgi:myo-inositol-1(or 4)-monophosphatase